jgi:hypothetical protein
MAGGGVAGAGRGIDGSPPPEPLPPPVRRCAAATLPCRGRNQPLPARESGAGSGLRRDRLSPSNAPVPSSLAARACGAPGITRSRLVPMPHTSILPFSSMTLPMSVETSARIISLWALPDGIIGKQFSSFDTMQSKITGPG